MYMCMVLLVSNSRKGRLMWSDRADQWLPGAGGMDCKGHKRGFGVTEMFSNLVVSMMVT